MLLTLYSLLFAGRLLPGDREDPEQSEQKPRDDLIATYHLAERLWEIWVRQDAPAAGTSLKEIGIGRRYGLSVISLLRDGRQQPVDEVEVRLKSEDVLLVGGRRERAEQLCREKEGLLLAGAPQPQTPFPASEAELIEIVVPPRSRPRVDRLGGDWMDHSNDLAARLTSVSYRNSLPGTVAAGRVRREIGTR